MRNCTLWLGLLAVCIAVAPVVKASWLAPPFGNPNLLFNLQLVFAVSCGSLVAEFAAGALRLARRERELAHARLRQGTCAGDAAPTKGSSD